MQTPVDIALVKRTVLAAFILGLTMVFASGAAAGDYLSGKLKVFGASMTFPSGEDKGFRGKMTIRGKNLKLKWTRSPSSAPIKLIKVKLKQKIKTRNGTRVSGSFRGSGSVDGIMFPNTRVILNLVRGSKSSGWKNAGGRNNLLIILKSPGLTFVVDGKAKS